jgi:hypothetical protein
MESREGFTLIELLGDQVEQDEGSCGMNCWTYSTSRDLQGRKASRHWKRPDHVRGAGNVPLFLDPQAALGGPETQIESSLFTRSVRERYDS